MSRRGGRGRHDVTLGSINLGRDMPSAEVASVRLGARANDRAVGTRRPMLTIAATATAAVVVAVVQYAVPAVVPVLGRAPDAPPDEWWRWSMSLLVQTLGVRQMLANLVTLAPGRVRGRAVARAYRLLPEQLPRCWHARPSLAATPSRLTTWAVQSGQSTSMMSTRCSSSKIR